MRPTHAASRLLTAIALVAASGCGTERYDERFQGNTVAYFGLAADIAAALGPTVSAEAVSFRPPIQFRQIAGRPQKDGPDPRQPLFLRLPLPGLAAAWQADVRVLPGPEDVAEPDAGPPTKRAYCFLLSEAALPKDALSGDARFDLLVVNRILGGLGLQPKTSREIGEGLRRFGYGYDRFGPEVMYDVLRFETTRVERRTTSIVDVYIHRGKATEAAVVLIYPAAIVRGENLEARMKLALASLETSAAFRSSGGGGGRPKAPVGPSI